MCYVLQTFSILIFQFKFESLCHDERLSLDESGFRWPACNENYSPEMGEGLNGRNTQVLPRDTEEKISRRVIQVGNFEVYDRACRITHVDYAGSGQSMDFCGEFMQWTICMLD